MENKNMNTKRGTIARQVKVSRADKVRQQQGLDPMPKEQKRDCLRCDKKFMSHSYSNRLCEDCRRKKEGD